MSRFNVYPTDDSFASAEITAPNVARVLSIVQMLDCKEAHVERDGEYVFSIRLGAKGLWCVFQREDEEPAIRALRLPAIIGQPIKADPVLVP
jgi:hypothetical protein